MEITNEDNMEKVNKYLPLIGLIVFLGSLAGGIYYFGGFMTTVENGVLTPEVKVRVEDHLNTMPTEVDNYKMFKTVDSIMKVEKKNTDDAIRSRAMRDSIIRDAADNANRNAVQIFQMKQQQDTIIKLLKKSK